MVALAMILILLGALLILAFVFVSEPGRGGEVLGFDVTILAAFLLGLAAAAAILWGLSLLRVGTKRGLEHRKERREYEKKFAKDERNAAPIEQPGVSAPSADPVPNDPGVQDPNYPNRPSGTP